MDGNVVVVETSVALAIETNIILRKSKYTEKVRNNNGSN